MAVRRHDQIGIRRDFGGDHELGIGLHDDFDPGGTRRGGKPVFGVGDHHPDDLDAMLPQHLEGRHAEMAGADQGNPHCGSVRQE